MVEYKGLDLAQLHKKQLSGVQLHDFARKNQVALEQAFTTAAENTGTLQQCYSNLAYDLKTLPAAMQRFRSSGEMTLDIPLPPNSRYYGVTFSDVRVYLVGVCSLKAQARVHLCFIMAFGREHLVSDCANLPLPASSQLDMSTLGQLVGARTI